MFPSSFPARLKTTVAATTPITATVRKKPVLSRMAATLSCERATAIQNTLHITARPAVASTASQTTCCEVSWMAIRRNRWGFLFFFADLLRQVALVGELFLQRLVQRGNQFGAALHGGNCSRGRSGSEGGATTVTRSCAIRSVHLGFVLP